MIVPINTLDDAKLIEHFQGGTNDIRDAAFSELVQRHNLRLLRYLAGKGLSLQEREDVAAEAWKRAWQAIDRFQYREEAGFFPWLRAIAINVMREYTRDRYLSRGSNTAEPVVLDFLPGDDNTTEAIIDATAEEIREAIKALFPEMKNADWRIVIEAYLLDGWETDDIMELNGWSRSKTHTTKSRAFQWLRTRLLERYGVADIDAWLGAG